MDKDEAISVMKSLLDKIEPLHPDLAPFLQEWERLPGSQMIHHKLVISLPHHDLQNAWVNQAYVHKLKAVEEAIAESNWAKYVFLHERPYRIDALMEAIHDLGADDPEVVWPLIASAWVDCENINECYNEWWDLLDLDMPRRELMMDDDERAALAALPDSITVYRGMGDRDAVSGMSWTTDRKKAQWFARRFAGFNGRTPIMATGVVEKKKVVAHFLGRGESEIVVLPDEVDVTDVATVRKLRK